jgi:magnesium-transporting ATPase (P-type)
MLDLVKEKLKGRKYLIQIIAIFVIFMFIYTLLDIFNGGYEQMRIDHGLGLSILNILLNIIMSGLSALMLTMSTIFFSLSGREGKGSFMSSFAVLFGVLTYGCTACVIALFAMIGITFSVLALPLAGLPYKLISLLILVIGLVWLAHEIKNPRCKLSKKK